LRGVVSKAKDKPAREARKPKAKRRKAEERDAVVSLGQRTRSGARGGRGRR
jgi:hypothetical protein